MDYLTGLLHELETGDDELARKYYLDSLLKYPLVNHRIRKATILRLMGLNKKHGLDITPERVLIQNYFVTSKSV